jgi:general secretion pathway protein C
LKNAIWTISDNAPMSDPTSALWRTIFLTLLLAAIAAASASLQSGFTLLGVTAQGEAGAHGSALIDVDGLPAKPYRFGQVAFDNVALQSVTAGSAALAAPGQAHQSMTLSLPVQQGMLQKQ